MTVALLVASGTTVLPLPQARSEGATEGKISVRVIRDVNGNGSYDPALEVGVAGLPVTVTAPNGATTAGTTKDDGAVSIDTRQLNGGKYRVAVSIPDSMPHLAPAPAGSGLSSLVNFVDVSDGKDVQVVTGVWNPSDYCQRNPTLITACQQPANEVQPTSTSLVTFPFTARGDTTAPEVLEDQQSTGTVYGIGYRKQDRRVFSAAFAKRATKYGPGGPGAIYATTPDGQTTLFATVPEAGGTQHEQSLADGAFFGVPGTESLGDLDISEDGSELYVVNLHNRRLYVYDATKATGGEPKASYPIPDPGCPSPADWRPGALGVHDGAVHLGGVCSGQSTQQLSDVRAAVHVFRNGAISDEPVLVKTLDFARGAVYSGRPDGNRWNPWTNNWADTAKYSPGHNVYPQPLMTDIGVEPNGDLVLGFRDRFGDMTGAALPAPDGSGGAYSSMSGGDLNRACAQPNGTFAWEGTGNCPNNATPGNSGEQPADVKEYYPGEHLRTVHNETAQGAFALVYGEQGMPSTVMDPIRIATGGVGWFDRSDGLVDGNAYQVTSEWGKSNGLADLEAICELAPVQIGNRVWFDANGNGVQDAGEPALPGVKVSLLPCDGGEPIATKTTDANGEYYFGAADKLRADTCYRVAFDYSSADTSGLPGKPPPTQLTWTRSTAGDDRCVDSNVDPKTGQAEVKVGRAGSVDHCVDAGVRRLNRLGDLVWVDTNRDGIQGDGEPGVPGVRVVVRDANGVEVAVTTTDDKGNYLFDKLPDGTYTVCFDRTSLPERYAEYQLTKRLSGDSDEDSDADPATWCTGPVTLGPDHPEDLTLDAGIAEPRNRLGDLVWDDRNGNGVQDPDEPGVAGVRVTARDVATGKLVEVRTDATGRYLFDDLPDGTYQVCVDRSTLPGAYANHEFTKQDSGSDDAADSDVAAATGCAPEVTLGPGKRENLTVDAGLYRQADGGGAVPPANYPPQNSPRPPGGLASTGATVGLVAGLAALVLAAGVTMLLLSRRRKRKALSG